MKKVIFVFLLVSSFSAQAVVTVGAQDCPNQFEGRVKEIIEPAGAEEFFSANKVVFENLHNIKGQAGESVLVDILRNGPFKVEADEEYRVFARGGKLCWIEKI